MHYDSVRAVREEPLSSIRDDILRLGVHRQEEGKVILSPKGAPQSWLIDLRRVFTHRKTLERIAGAFWARFGEEPSFQIAAMETAAIPLLTAVMLCAPKGREDINSFIVRKERKAWGLCRAIEGEVTQEPVILLDDILNSGKSAEKAISVIKQVGRRVSRMFTVVDYCSRRGLRWREDNGINVTSLFILADFDLSVSDDPPPPLQQYRELWRTEVPGAFPFNVVPKSAPTLVGKRLYRGSDVGKMHCFDAETGSVVWEYSARGAGRKGIMSCPLVHEGRVYFGAFNGVIYCLDALTGEEVWSQSYGDWVGSSPVIVPRHRLVYFGIEYGRPWAQGSIGAFNMDTGERVWEHLVKKLQHGSPCYWRGGDLILWGTADYEMAALEAATGNIVWTFNTRRSVKYAPAVDEERGWVAFASFDTSIYLLDVRTGQKLGEWQTGEICYTTPLFVGDKLFCGSGDHSLYVIDLVRREVIKKLDLGARVYSSPRMVAGRVVVGSASGRVIEVDPETLEIKGSLQLPDAVTNAVASTPEGSRIFVSTYMNQLFAFERVVAHGADGPGSNFRLMSSDCDIEVLRAEIVAQPEMWQVNTTRQNTLTVQRETESVFLRAARRAENSAIALEDTHDSGPTQHAKRYPRTLEWVMEFARKRNGQLGRVILARLKPHGHVYRHFDRGEYYRVRDRYHLVISSAAGSLMRCADDEVVMREGELWWFDNKKPHESFNHSEEGRIHLIFDVLP